MSKPNVRIPQPDCVRRIDGSFAWIDHRLLRNGFLATMTHQDQCLYLFLALAADRHGVSFYRKEKICELLGLDFGAFEIARDRLIGLSLIAFTPYSAITVNGFYQLLPVPPRAPDFAAVAPAVVSTPAPTVERASAQQPAPVAKLAAQLAHAFRSV